MVSFVIVSGFSACEKAVDAAKVYGSWDIKNIQPINSTPSTVGVAFGFGKLIFKPDLSLQFLEYRGRLTPEILNITKLKQVIVTRILAANRCATIRQAVHFDLMRKIPAAHDIRKLNLRWFHSRISIILRHGYMFTGK